MDLDGLAQLGFVELGRVPDQELTLGIIANFWSLVPKPESFAPHEFAEKRAGGDAPPPASAVQSALPHEDAAAQ